MYAKKAQKGDIWVGGTNLGCSSSRNAPLFLKDKGIGAVVCSSASRIFYRNAVNSGLPIFSIGDDAAKIKSIVRQFTSLDNKGREACMAAIVKACS